MGVGDGDPRAVTYIFELPSWFSPPSTVAPFKSGIMVLQLTLPEALDLTALSEEQCLAFYGAMFAIAAADDAIDEVESDLILDSLDLDALSEDARQKALALSIAPPSLQTCLDFFLDADDHLRLGLMLNLVDVALADDEIEPGEPMTLEQARISLGVTPEQVEMMHTYAYRVRQHAVRTNTTLQRPMACPQEICEPQMPNP
jgi:uncharacterized tellurite resistance protein B-like protein